MFVNGTLLTMDNRTLNEHRVENAVSSPAPTRSPGGTRLQLPSW